REYALPVAVGVVEPVPSNALENQVGGKESPAVCDGSRPPGEFRPGPRQFVTYQAQYLDRAPDLLSARLLPEEARVSPVGAFALQSVGRPLDAHGERGVPVHAGEGGGRLRDRASRLGCGVQLAAPEDVLLVEGNAEVLLDLTLDWV